jgi:hypothetical protein
MSHHTCPYSLTVKDLTALAALQADVAATAPHGYLRPKTDDDLRAIVEGRTGRAFGVRKNGSLIAAGLLTYPAPPPPGMPAFPRVPIEDWTNHVAFFDNDVVRSDMRGRGLQRVLFDIRLAHARATGRRWFCAGVHAGNVVSWRNLIAKGMAIVGFADFHAYPLVALLRAEHGGALATTGPACLAAAHDLAAHQRALNEGMIGVAFDQGVVTYRRAIQPITVGRAVLSGAA